MENIRKPPLSHGVFREVKRQWRPVGQEVGHVRSRGTEHQGKGTVCAKVQSLEQGSPVLVTTEGQLVWKEDSKGAQGQWGSRSCSALLSNYLSLLGPRICEFCFGFFFSVVVVQSLTHVQLSLTGSSVHGISQAEILEWVAILFSKDLWVLFCFVLFSCTVKQLAQC